MTFRSPAEFVDHAEWLGYVRKNVPLDEQSYVLARGRTELFKQFYKLRNHAFPVQLSAGVEQVEGLPKSERASGLEELNDRIFANMIALLSVQAEAVAIHNDAQRPQDPRKIITELSDYLGKRNRYFAIWADYKRQVEGPISKTDWERLLLGQVGSTNGDLDFAGAMMELERLLTYFHETGAPLPRFVFERCWFLHHLREPERMLQTRAILNSLTAELGGCASV